MIPEQLVVADIAAQRISAFSSNKRTPTPVLVTDALMTCGPTTTGFHQMKTTAAATTIKAVTE